jgi:hypothetical protein
MVLEPDTEFKKKMNTEIWFYTMVRECIRHQIVVE